MYVVAAVLPKRKGVEVTVTVPAPVDAKGKTKKDLKGKDLEPKIHTGKTTDDGVFRFFGIRGAYPQGVCLNKPLNKFIAECNVNGKRQYLGLSNTAEEAGKVYKVFKSKLIRSVAEKQSEPLRGYLTRIAGEFK